MTSEAANIAVRERRRRSAPTDLEQLNIMKALTAAEHSRRQFVLNYSASKDTSLLIPGRKSEVVKLAEQWVFGWLHQNNLNPVSGEFFKYTVDTQLWATYVGDAVDFPFTFMRSTADDSTIVVGPVSRRESDTTQVRPLSQVDPLDKAQTEESTQSDERPPSSTVPSQANVETRQPPVLSAPITTRQWPSMRKRQSPTVTELRTGDENKRRSLSLTSIDDLKMSKGGPPKVPLFTRLGRSWSRRMSAA
ncbi:hypothetical protein QBC40DRAFT_7835 [Triangularia verruculosa]|uniref:Uncharacterized protein n=1 Tax=Triangularia verruculosa TaxID=2587418 RepID=A0AAN6XQM8_9PEZI|nr:hypothetical protein QBC40DRAFT_7835 [Triangularia verruculosa]